jgi:two-component system OmpR family response regulator
MAGKFPASVATPCYNWAAAQKIVHVFALFAAVCSGGGPVHSRESEGPMTQQSDGQEQVLKPDEGNHILLVEDERSVRDPLGHYLQRNGFRVTMASHALEARHLLSRYKFDLIILDIMMPGEDGLSLCRSIREKFDIPTILLSAKSEETDRIIGLEMGADDYVVKPFAPRELLARAKAVIRRAQSVPRSRKLPVQKTLQFGTWTLKTGARQLVGEDGSVVPLSTGEFNLLLAFIERPHIVLTRDQLLDLTQGREASAFDRSIDNLISRVRKKIEPDSKNPSYIKTVWGGGYSFVGEVRQI